MSTMNHIKKRKLSCCYSDTSYYPKQKKHKSNDNPITNEFIRKCKDEFNGNNQNIVIQNAVTMVGSTLASTNSKHVNKVSHVFMNTVKPKSLKATDQGQTGRCWLFSGLNVIRTIVIKALGISNFELSESYLFFWDKWERSNTFLTEIINHPNIDIDNRYMEYVLDPSSLFCDGGWWNMFANLVNKYGLMPKSAFGETYQSSMSSDMNDTLRDYVVSTAHYIYAHPNLSCEQKNKIREEALAQVYSILCKYFGEPPSLNDTFEWKYTTTEYESQIIRDLTPIKFRDNIMPGLSLEDYIVLAHMPGKEYYQKYEICSTTNMVGANNFSFINVPIDELKKHTMNTITAGLPVWFAADVGRSFHYWLSALDEDLFNSEALFGKRYKFDKLSRINFRQTSACHAMVFTGFNIDENGPINWQVENSWGYWDEDEAGLDGWLTMDDKWFTENVFQVAIHKSFIKGSDSHDRHLLRVLNDEPIILPPWNNFAPALKVGNFAKPENYRNKDKSLAMMKRLLKK